MSRNDFSIDLNDKMTQYIILGIGLLIVFLILKSIFGGIIGGLINSLG